MSLAKVRLKKYRMARGTSSDGLQEINNAILELKKLKKSANIADGKVSVFISKNSVVVRTAQENSNTRMKVLAGSVFSQTAQDRLSDKNYKDSVRSSENLSRQHRDLAYLDQMGKLIKAATLDNNKAVATLKSSPSSEALAFYGSLSKKNI